tara:strand:+ start:2906 stop:3874 length:969 start_codon:yes stop_codon:yes gene_type:complete
MGIFDLLRDEQGRLLESPRPMSRAQGAEQAASNAAQRSSMMEDVNFRRDFMGQLGFDAGNIMTEPPYSNSEMVQFNRPQPLAAYFPLSANLRREDQVYMGPSVENDPNILAHEFRHRGSRKLMDHYGLRGASDSSPEVQSFIENYGLTAYDTLMGDNEYLVELFDSHPETPLNINYLAEGAPFNLSHMGDTLDKLSEDALLNRENTGYFSTEQDRVYAALDPELSAAYKPAFPNLGQVLASSPELDMDAAYTGVNRAARDALMDRGQYNPQPGDIRPMARPYLPSDVKAQEDFMSSLIERRSATQDLSVNGLFDLMAPAENR